MASIKLDENLGRRGAGILRAHGHSVATVHDQTMCAATDRELIQHCHAEGRCLVTLDLDLASPLAFPPTRYSGIAVLRLPSAPSPDGLLSCVETLARALLREDILGRLWIVQPGRVRVYEG